LEHFSKIFAVVLEHFSNIFTVALEHFFRKKTRRMVREYEMRTVLFCGIAIRSGIRGFVAFAGAGTCFFDFFAKTGLTFRKNGLY
jgi:hypothetical protein